MCGAASRVWAAAPGSTRPPSRRATSRRFAGHSDTARSTSTARPTGPPRRQATFRPIHALSLEADGVALIRPVVRRAAGGDYVPLAQEYVDRVGVGLDARARLAMSFAILCSEPWARFDPGRVRRSSAGSYLARVAEARAELFARACRFVPKGVVPAASTRLVPTQVPVLVLAGGADPPDPPGNGRGWGRDFPR